MQVDHVLILAAGKGTRMGGVGKKLPKVIWPIFNKSIIELEYLYAKKYCEKNIYINLYNYKDKVKKHIQESSVMKNVHLVEEQEILDIGGAIHNLAKQLNYKGKLLVLNSDQFIMLNDQKWEHFYQMSNSFDSVILTYDVDKNDKYNETVVKSGTLMGITENSLIQKQKHETYTGMSIINLESLENIQGESKFFKTVADYEKKNIGALNIQDSQYWDFGTIARYYFSMFDILKMWKENTPFIEFLKINHALDENKISSKSYDSDKFNVICLAENSEQIENTIYLSKVKIDVPKEKCIVYEDIIETP